MAYAITVLVSLLFTKDSQIILNFQHISRLSIPLKKKENVRNQKITSLKLRHQSDLKKILNFLKPYVYLLFFLFTDLLWKTNVEVSSLINYNCQCTGRQSYLIQFHNLRNYRFLWPLAFNRYVYDFLILLESFLVPSLGHWSMQLGNLTLCQRYKISTQNFSSAYLTLFSMWH